MVAQDVRPAILRTTAEFTSHSTGQQYQLKTTASCKTMNVVYIIQCKKCGQQYVGETTQALHCRMNNHRADIIHKKIENKPVAVHFSTQRHSVEDLEVMVIDRLWKDAKEQGKQVDQNLGHLLS